MTLWYHSSGHIKILKHIFFIWNQFDFFLKPQLLEKKNEGTFEGNLCFQGS